MKRDFFSNISLLVMMLIVVSSLALALPTGGNVTEGATTHGTGSASEALTAYGGNVTEVNVSGTFITTKWTGFYGFISGGIQLTDASANKFYAWTISNFTGGYVYATNATVSTWSGMIPMTHLSAPAGVQSGASDDYNHTFTTTASFVSPGLGTIGSTPYTVTYQNGAAGSLRTYALTSADTLTNLWVGGITTNAASFKSGEQVDYQILAPAKDTGTVYNFYLEMP